MATWLPHAGCVNAPALLEFLVHGAKYLYPGVMRGEARGIPTAWGRPPLSELLAPTDQGIPVWPDPLGPIRGIGVEPLHSIVPEAARRDEALAEKLALVDAIRLGDPRQRALAEDELSKALGLGQDR